MDKYLSRYQSNHGSIVALVKAALYPNISMIDIEYEGVIAFELSCAPGLRFVGMYNEPTDSLYFRPMTLASITRNVASGKHCVVVRDVNACLGKSQHDLMYNVLYNGTNENGKTLSRICQLLPVNDLVTSVSKWPS